MLKQDESSTVVTARLPRDLYERLREQAEANLHSQAAEIRQAIAGHVLQVRGRQRAPVRAGTPQGAVEAGARAHRGEGR